MGLRILTVFLAALAATPLAAEVQTYSVLLGGRDVGRITFDTSGPVLTSVLDNTPMGVGDGTFRGTTRQVRLDSGEVATQYVGEGEDRVISVILADGRAVETVVRPANEETALSDPAAVPTGIVDPATAFGLVARASGCPRSFRMYDGRRVVEAATVAEASENGDLVCDMDYRVVAGPGHLSPFRFTDIGLRVVYDAPPGGPQRLRRVAVSAGLFTLVLAR